MRCIVRAALPTYQTRMRAQVGARPSQRRIGLIWAALLYAVLVVLGV